MRVWFRFALAVALGGAGCGRDSTANGFGRVVVPGESGGPDAGVDAGFFPPPVFDLGLPDPGFPDAGFPPLDGGFLPEVGVVDTGVLLPDGGSAFPDADVPPDGGVECVSDVDCIGLDDACNAGTCIGGRCFSRPRPNGTPCDDGEFCTADDACQGGVCRGRSLVPANDSCIAPAILPTSVGGIVRTGDTICADDDEQGTCTASGGRDAVYRFTLSDPRRVRFTTEGGASGSFFDTALYLRPTCTSTVELICSDDAPNLGRLSRVEDNLDPGTYFLWIDGANGASAGPYQLNFEVDPHNVCTGAADLALPPVNQTTVIRGTTRDGSNDFRAQCGASNGADHVYRITVQQDTRVRFETQTTPQQFDTVLHLHPGPCAQGFQTRTACDDDGGSGTLSQLTATLTPGDWFLVVDGFGSNEGRYELAVTTLAPPGPPVVVTFPSSGDLRLTASSTAGDQFSTTGDLVEGTRFLPAETWTQAQINLQVTNRMTCGTLRVQPQFNRVGVGLITIGPGDTSINQTFTLFSPLTGGSTNIRYQVFGTLPANCGSVDFPNGVSTVTFRSN